LANWPGQHDSHSLSRRLDSDIGDSSSEDEFEEEPIYDIYDDSDSESEDDDDSSTTIVPFEDDDDSGPPFIPNDRDYMDLDDTDYDEGLGVPVGGDRLGFVNTEGWSGLIYVTDRAPHDFVDANDYANALARAVALAQHDLVLHAIIYPSTFQYHEYTFAHPTFGLQFEFTFKPDPHARIQLGPLQAALRQMQRSMYHAGTSAFSTYATANVGAIPLQDRLPIEIFITLSVTVGL
jgi:hypothetical protein